MDPQSIRITDWKRILFGDAPPYFLIEVVFRTLLVYVMLLVVMRAFGKRMAAQLTILEMGIMMAIGAIVSVPMQVPTQGIVLPVILLGAILLLQQGLGRLGYSYRRLELLSQGDVKPLIRDGVVLLHELRSAGLSQEQLYAVLRSTSIHQLGEIQRLYLEAGGQFSTFKFPEPRPGLPILPGIDEAIRARYRTAAGHLSCERCGLTVPAPPGNAAPPKWTCANCGYRRCLPAVA